MSKAKKMALGFLILLLLVLPYLVTPYILQICILTMTYSILGLVFASALRVGLPRFDIAAWWGVGAYSTAVLMQKAHMSFWLTILIGGLIAVVLGWVLFSVTLPRGMMVFLMFGMVAAMAIQQLYGSVDFFGGWGGTGTVPRPTIGSFIFVNKPELYYLGLFLLIVIIAAYLLLYNSRIGRAWKAIGFSLKLASSAGVNVVKYRMANVLIGNFFLAVAGSYFVAFSLVAVPAQFSFNNSIYIMMYAIVGGLFHPLAGPVIGALIITFIPEYLRVAKEYEPIITAAALIIIMVFLPMGVLGLFDRWLKPRLTRLMWFRRKAGGVSKAADRN